MSSASAPCVNVAAWFVQSVAHRAATHTPWKDRLETKDTLRGELEQVRRNLSEALAFRTEHYRSAVGSVVLGGSGRTRVQTLAEEIRRFFELVRFPFIWQRSVVDLTHLYFCQSMRAQEDGPSPPLL